MNKTLALMLAGMMTSAAVNAQKIKLSKKKKKKNRRIKLIRLKKNFRTKLIRKKRTSKRFQILSSAFLPKPSSESRTEESTPIR